MRHVWPFNIYAAEVIHGCCEEQLTRVKIDGASIITMIMIMMLIMIMVMMMMVEVVMVMVVAMMILTFHGNSM